MTFVYVPELAQTHETIFYSYNDEEKLYKLYPESIPNKDRSYFRVELITLLHVCSP